MVIELDGDSHIGRVDADHRRTEFLANRGMRVVRFGNDDVLRELDWVVEMVLKTCKSGLADRKGPSP